eukprot:jgi/Ulvmu1/1468/UM011_0198.1
MQSMRGSDLTVSPIASRSATQANRRTLRPQTRQQRTRQTCGIVNATDRSHETDVVIIGSGIGGLSCAALLAHYGLSVTVCEAHYHAGGAAHGFEVQGYKFDAGPSFHAGLSVSPSSNPLKQVLDIVGESVPCKTYDRWIVYNKDGTFPCIAGADGYRANIFKQGGPEALAQWEALEREMRPLQAGAGLFPAAGMRGDPGVLLTAGMFGVRAGWAFAQTGLQAGKLTGPFSDIVDKVVTDPWLRNFIDLECFVLSGMPARDTICAEMAFMFMERNKPDSSIDYPLGGSAALVDALVRGIEKHGGCIMLRAPVDSVVMEGGRATGVRLKGDGSEVIRARKAVVSNASIWDTQRLVPQDGAAARYAAEADAMQPIESFMHLHLGIDAAGLPADLECHHLIVNDWSNIQGEQNVCIASIPTVFDPSLAPAGKAVVHAYTAANEPWELWEGVSRGTAEYAALKRERAEVLWRALERIIPDIRERTELEMIGTPLTHARYLRRHKGTYGPGVSAQDSTFPGPVTPIPGLYGCGDSYMPGIGVPAAAASGMIAANTLVSLPAHFKMLSKLQV